MKRFATMVKITTTTTTGVTTIDSIGEMGIIIAIKNHVVDLTEADVLTVPHANLSIDVSTAVSLDTEFTIATNYKRTKTRTTSIEVLMSPQNKCQLTLNLITLKNNNLFQNSKVLAISSIVILQTL